jgi:hypothetical protein
MPYYKAHAELQAHNSYKLILVIPACTVVSEGIEICDEYLISKAPLIHFLRPKKIIDRIIGGVEFVEPIIKFLERESVHS